MLSLPSQGGCALLYTSSKMNLTRRSLLGMAAAVPVAMAAASPAPAVKLGIDLFSLRSQGWTPFQLLDYSAKLTAKVVHFSEIRFIGNLEPDNLRAVRRYAEERGIEIEIGMKSICPTSKMFDAKAGTAEEQIGKMLDSATLAGSHIVRAVLGSMEDRRPGPIEKHMESMVQGAAQCTFQGAGPQPENRHRKPRRRHAGARTQAGD